MELRVNGFWVIGGSKLIAKIIHTYSFINSLRCFISLRGAVQQLHCDQGSNFVGARNELKEALKQCDTKLLEIFLTEKQCKFCPGRLDDASLRTLLYEAMAVVNSRPLTVDGINDPLALEPITPNHLIMMKSKVALPPPGVFVKEDLYATKRWRRVQYLIEQIPETEMTLTSAQPQSE
ncbi:hypothetical protein FQN60_010598 [Etheostoma spectabile]|uniref:Integrase catalytic domain-containing protein n=1 Tax=Etheostoma spectabile TaxID=54343 RepID=A0A5J5C887_9PERO|nr:hypothetical protein FQN60_007915 [Etheostoma spectabile]KAA8577897.1 hypothetical protein FQN60_010598 [Etheostoma spectabile]